MTHGRTIKGCCFLLYVASLYLSRYLVSLQCLHRAEVGCTWMQRGTQHPPWVGPVLLSTPHSHWSPHLLQNQPKPKNTFMQSKIYSLLLTCQALCNGLRCNVTHLSWWPAAREEVSVVIAMKRDVEDAGVAVEHFLGAVAMVNILESTRCGRHNNIIHSQQNRR